MRESRSKDFQMPSLHSNKFAVKITQITSKNLFFVRENTLSLFLSIVCVERESRQSQNYISREWRQANAKAKLYYWDPNRDSPISFFQEAKLPNRMVVFPFFVVILYFFPGLWLKSHDPGKELDMVSTYLELCYLWGRWALCCLMCLSSLNNHNQPRSCLNPIPNAM